MAEGMQTASRKAAKAERRAGRWLALDLLRFCAVFLMVQGHTFSSLLDPSVRAERWYQHHNFVHGYTAPMFLFENLDLFEYMVIGLLLGVVAMLIVGLALAHVIIHVLLIPRENIMAVVIAMGVMGAYASKLQYGDVWMMLAFGVATAGFTRSPEHAQVTTLPIALDMPITATWVGISGTESLTSRLG